MGVLGRRLRLANIATLILAFLLALSWMGIPRRSLDCRGIRVSHPTKLNLTAAGPGGGGKEPAPPTGDNNNTTEPLRIAVLLSGFVRGYQTSFENIKQQVIGPNVALNHTVDIYLHTWDIEGQRVSGTAGDERYDEAGTTLSQTPIKLAELEAALGHKNGSGHLLVESFNQTSLKWMATDNLAGKERRWGFFKTRHQIISKCGMWYGVKRAYELASAAAAAAPPGYDVMLRARPDMAFHSPVVFRKAPGAAIAYHARNGAEVFSLRESGGVERILLPSRGDTGNDPYWDDWTAIGSPRLMSKYAATFDHLPLYLDILWQLPKWTLNSEDIVPLNAWHLRLHVGIYKQDYDRAPGNARAFG